MPNSCIKLRTTDKMGKYANQKIQKNSYVNAYEEAMKTLMKLKVGLV